MVKPRRYFGGDLEIGDYVIHMHVRYGEATDVCTTVTASFLTHHL